MRYITLLLAAVCSLTTLTSQDYPFTHNAWQFDAQQHEITEHLGKQALYIKNGVAHLADIGFQDGIIEFDIALPDARSFSGFAWRQSDQANYEEIYFRPHLSGYPDAMQYSPVWNATSGWQLYHDQSTSLNDGSSGWRYLDGHTYNALYTYPFDAWMHVRLEVKGQEAWLYLDHSDKPVLHVPALHRPATSGGLDLHSGLAGAYFANYRIEVRDPVYVKPVKENLAPANQITAWKLSDVIQESAISNLNDYSQLFRTSRWESVESEGEGLLNISRYRKRTRTDSTAFNTVLVRHTVKANQASIEKLVFGYSDRVKIFVNGRLIYAGDNGYRSRDYRYLGTIGYFDQIYVQLGAGKNEIVFAVSENFGGWGLQARLGEIPD